MLMCLGSVTSQLIWEKRLLLEGHSSRILKLNRRVSKPSLINELLASQYMQLLICNMHLLLFYSNQVKITVQGFINLDQNVAQFKEHLRDFLVQIRVSVPLVLIWLNWLNCIRFPYISNCLSCSTSGLLGHIIGRFTISTQITRFLFFIYFHCLLFFAQEFTGEDDTDLYLEEREASLRQAEQAKRKVQMSVPGILNPHEFPEDMQDEVSNYM